MAFQEKQLFQARLGSTTITSVYSPAAATTAIIKQIAICNTTAGALTFRLCVDDDGTTYDETTALYWDTSIAANSTVLIDCFIPMHQDAGNIAFRTSSASGLTITGFGAEIT